MSSPEMSRREFICNIAELLLRTTTVGVATRSLINHTSEQPRNHSEWPRDQEGILARIKDLPFPKGSFLSTTLMPRKMMWELAQWYKAQNNWPKGADESDWLGNLHLFEWAVSVLHQAGIKSARLALLPSELTLDGVHYDFAPLETSIELLQKQGIATEIAVGPFNFPYYPGGRFPQTILEQFNRDIPPGKNLVIDLNDQPSDPPVKKVAREYGLRFINELMQRYGHDPRIRQFYVGNEWPDRNELENGHGTIETRSDFTRQTILNMMVQTDKPIALNTNIHPSQQSRFDRSMGPILKLLGPQGVTGIDTYPSREAEVFRLRVANHSYGHWIENLREHYPMTQFEFTEYQAEPWPDKTNAGKAWADMDLDLLSTFYQTQFPPTLDSHLIPSQITKVSIWGAPVLPVAVTRGYDFPVRMLATMAETMEQGS